MNPSDNPQSFPERNQVPLRVRFYPLWLWYFVGCLLVAQTFLVTRLWGGWNAMALLQLVAFQVIFLPRIALIAVGASLGLTLLTSRLVSWIARPMAVRWLAPLSILPPESEIPLYLRTGERPLIQVPGRRKVQTAWEPGWLIVTEGRLIWLSGIWRTVCWDIDTDDSAWPLESRVRPGRTSRWFGGYVVGMPPRLIAERYDDAENALITEVLAIADPAGFMKSLAEIRNPVCPPEPSVPSAPGAVSDSLVDLPPRRGLSSPVPTAQSAGSSHPALPPLRDYASSRVRRGRTRGSSENVKPQRVGTIVGAVVLPPRREWN